MDDLQYLIKQLDLLIGFLEVSNEYIYNKIKTNDQFKTGLTIEDLYENNFDNFKNHITTSSFLLGFAHFEDFLTKCVSKYRISNTNISTKKPYTFAEKIIFIETYLNGISPNILTEIKFVNKIRNCLMHNNGFADGGLSPKYSKGQKIVLNAWEVHGYGIQVRQLAEEIWGNL